MPLRQAAGSSFFSFVGSPQQQQQQRQQQQQQRDWIGRERAAPPLPDLHRHVHGVLPTPLTVKWEGGG